MTGALETMGDLNWTKSSTTFSLSNWREHYPYKRDVNQSETGPTLVAPAVKSHAWRHHLITVILNTLSPLWWQCVLVGCVILSSAKHRYCRLLAVGYQWVTCLAPFINSQTGCVAGGLGTDCSHSCPGILDCRAGLWSRGGSCLNLQWIWACW